MKPRPAILHDVRFSVVFAVSPSAAACRVSDEALGDDVYRLPEDYVGRGGFSWIHRWTRTNGLPIKPEPEPPAWVTKGWENRTQQP